MSINLTHSRGGWTRRDWLRKYFNVIVLSGLLLGGFVGTVIAQNSEIVSFGIRPTQAFPDRPETFAYFSHEISPGVTISDEALVMNLGNVPLKLNLDAVDGVTAMNTGSTLAMPGQESTGASRGTHRWISLSRTEVKLKPGEELLVPFTISVPADASPGHHVAGLVLEAPQSESDYDPGGDGQFAVNVIQRVGVAVLIDVPGLHIAGLEITDAVLMEQHDQGATFVIAVRNTGNIYLKGDGTLQIADLNSENLASIPLKMDTILPGDQVTFQVVYPIHLGDGDYVLSVEIDYEDKTAFIEEVEITVENGQPKAGSEVIILPPSVVEIFAPSTGEADPIVKYALCVVPLLVLLVLIFVIILGWKRRRAQHSSIQYVDVILPLSFQYPKDLRS